MASQRGNIAIILCLLLLASGAGFYFFYTGASTPEEKPADPMVVFDDLRTRAEAALNQPAVLNFTVERNSNSFACLFTSAAECGGGGGAFQLFEKTDPGSQPLSQLIRDFGLTPEGMGCRGFPSDACPLKVEASWSPVCAGPRCEGTRSAKLKVRVMYQPTSTAHELWEQEREYTPQIVLSKAVECERGGGAWAGTDCMSAGQSDREIASGEAAPPVEAAPPPVELPTDVQCPAHIEIQGDFFTVEHLGPNRGQARTPAMNGCPGEDIFVFQCQAKSNLDREGHWVQVEAQMAPRCDQPPGEENRQ
jgi:hypothetical protein